MNNKPICTVLLITYNHKDYIHKAIQSVLSQKTKYPFVIKIFDDASTDGSSDIIREYVDRHPDLIKAYIAKKNHGPQANFWRAFKSIDTKYFCLLETDDYWTDNKKLELQISALEDNQDCSFCCHQSLIKNIADETRAIENNTKLIKNKFVLSNQKISLGDILKQPVSTGYISSATSRLIRTECLNLDKITHKESVLFDNAQFYYLLLKGNMYFIDREMSVYNQTGTGTWSGASILQRIKNYNAAMEELMEEMDNDVIKLRLCEEMAAHIQYCCYVSRPRENNKVKKKKLSKQLYHYFTPPFIRDVIKPKTYIRIIKFVFSKIKNSFGK